MSTGEAAEARTRRRQIADFEWHWDGAFTGTRWEGGKFTTTYTTYTDDKKPVLGQIVTGESIAVLRGEARSYYSRMHADRSST